MVFSTTIRFIGAVKFVIKNKNIYSKNMEIKDEKKENYY